MFASSQNDLYLANIFLCYSCDVNLLDTNKRNALFYAINSNGDSCELVSLLIANGINVNQSDKDGQTPLTLAVIKADKEVTRILLNSGVNVDHQTIDGNTALHYAVSQDCPDLIYLLLLRKPDLNLRNKNDQTAMDISMNLSRTEVYQILAEEYHNRETLQKSPISNSPKNQDLDTEIKDEESLKGINSLNPTSNIKFFDKEGPVRTNTLQFISTKNPELTSYNSNLQNLSHISNFQNNVTNNPNTNVPNNTINNIPVFQNSSQSTYNSQSSNNTFNNLPTQINNSNYQQNSTLFTPSIMNLQNNLNSYENYNTNPIPNSQTNNSVLYSNTSNQNNFPNFNFHQYGNINHSYNIRGGMPISFKSTKAAKLHKLKILSERSQLRNGKEIKDKVFKFPSDQSNLGTIQVPFSFQSTQNMTNGNPQTGSRFTKGSHLHTYISIYLFN